MIVIFVVILADFRFVWLVPYRQWCFTIVLITTNKKNKQFTYVITTITTQIRMNYDDCVRERKKKSSQNKCQHTHTMEAEWGWKKNSKSLCRTLFLLPSMNHTMTLNGEKLLALAFRPYESNSQSLFLVLLLQKENYPRRYQKDRTNMPTNHPIIIQ